MLGGMYRRHGPDSSRPADLIAGDPPGQAKRLEYLRVGEDDVARYPAAADGENLERVRPVPAAGIRRVSGERRLPVGGELPDDPARPAHIEHAPHEQAIVVAAPVPQRHWWHLQHRLVSEQLHERRNVCGLERLHVLFDDRADPGIIRLADLAALSGTRDGGASSLQGAVDRRDRGPELP